VDWLLSEFVQLFLIAIILFVIAALLAPLESLGWWAGWSNRFLGPLSLPALPSLPVHCTQRGPTCYLVFLSGVGITDVSTLTPNPLSLSRPAGGPPARRGGRR